MVFATMYQLLKDDFFKKRNLNVIFNLKQLHNVHSLTPFKDLQTIACYVYTKLHEAYQRRFLLEDITN